jgi:hypothetical protein
VHAPKPLEAAARLHFMGMNPNFLPALFNQTWVPFLHPNPCAWTPPEGMFSPVMQAGTEDHECQSFFVKSSAMFFHAAHGTKPFSEKPCSIWESPARKRLYVAYKFI